jgi:hypothetical protein
MLGGGLRQRQAIDLEWNGRFSAFVMAGRQGDKGVFAKRTHLNPKPTATL